MLSFFTKEYLDLHPEVNTRVVYQPIKEFLIENLDLVHTLSEEVLFNVAFCNRSGRNWPYSKEDNPCRMLEEDDIRNLTPEDIEQKVDDVMAMLLCIVVQPHRIYDYCAVEQQMVYLVNAGSGMREEHIFDANFFITRELEFMECENDIDTPEARGWELDEYCRLHIGRYQLFSKYKNGTKYNSYGEMRRAHLKEVLLTEPADLTIYRYREFVPRNVEIVADPRGLFRKLYGSELEAGRLLQDEKVQEFIKILSPHTEQVYLPSDLSYGCIVAILAYMHPNLCFDIDQCDNRTQIEIIKLNRGNLVISHVPLYFFGDEVLPDDIDMNCILYSYALHGGDYMSRITCYNDLFNTYRWYTI